MDVKSHFPIFNERPDLVYLDSAASSQTPTAVLQAMQEYYERARANIHRGVYALSEEATLRYENARETIARFLHANPGEIILTSGTTFGLNLLAQTLAPAWRAGDNIVLSRMEHHANLVPWTQMAKRYGFEVRYVELTSDFGLRTSDMPIDRHTKLVSITHVSNVLGTVNPIQSIIEQAKKLGALTVIDAAQSVAHMPIDVKKLDCDFLAFSGHKMYGPTGIGVLYGKKNLLEHMTPFLFGGDMIREVTYADATWADPPYRFEAGTPNIAGAIGLGEAIRFIERIGWEEIMSHEADLAAYALAQLKTIPEVRLIGPQTPHDRLGVLSMVIEGVHPHDVATLLDREQIAIRVGHHCAMPLMNLLGLSGTNRASFSVFSTREDVDRLIAALRCVVNVFRA